MDLNYFKELKNKNAVVKIEKILVDGVAQVKVTYKQFDALTGAVLPEAFVLYDLQSLRTKKITLKDQIDQINAVLTEIKEALN